MLTANSRCLSLLPVPWFLQVWRAARRGSPAVHRQHIDGALHRPGGHAASSQHHRAGQTGNTAVPPDQANWEAARHRWVILPGVHLPVCC